MVEKCREKESRNINQAYEFQVKKKESQGADWNSSLYFLGAMIWHLSEAETVLMIKFLEDYVLFFFFLTLNSATSCKDLLHTVYLNLEQSSHEKAFLPG